MWTRSRISMQERFGRQIAGANPLVRGVPGTAFAEPRGSALSGMPDALHLLS